jgi:hypothetical protein
LLSKGGRRAETGGENIVNRNIVILAVALLAMAMLATPLAMAVPGAEKKNEKFQTWHYEKTVSFLILLFGEHEYIPSFDEVNVMVITSTEGFITYEITVGSYTYVQGVDFDCVDVYTEYTAIKPVFEEGDTQKLWPYQEQAQAAHLLVETTFDFSAYPGSIEGTLTIQERGGPGGPHTVSLRGTGDLRNAQVQATYANTFNPATYVLTVTDDGTVIGWPDIAPL